MTRAKSERRPPPLTAPPGGGAPRGLIALLFFLLAIPLYGNTLGHQYALDDTIVITDNAYTKQGLRGIPGIFGHDSFQGFLRDDMKLVSGGRYRPLSIATFALEYQTAGLNPGLSHLVNLALYGLTGSLLYLLLSRLLPSEGRARWWIAPPVLITLLFITHPLHTEVVANIKGRDEILAFLFGLGAFHACLSYCDRGRGGGILSLVAAGFFMLLALMSKESVIPFLLLIPAGLWFFRSLDRRRLGVVFGALVLSTAVYLAVRSTYAGPMATLRTIELLNDPFAQASVAERVATVFKTFGIYLRLFLIPHPLTHDYYYNQVPVTGFGDFAALLPAAIALGLAIAMLAGIPGRNPIAFGVLFFVASFSIVSNLFFSVGTTMAERFLYIPSLGLAVSLVYSLRSGAAQLLGKAGPRAAGIALILLSAAFSAKTVTRNAVWKDNLTLFSTDVKVSPRSAKVQGALGAVLGEMATKEADPATKQRMLEEAIVHLQKAVEIYPRHSLAWFGLGNAWSAEGGAKLTEAVQCYRRVLAIEPDRALAYRNLALVVDKLGDHEAAISNIRHYRTLKPKDREAGLLEAEYFEEAGQPDSAIAICEDLIRDQPRNGPAWGEQGRLIAKYRHDYSKAIDFLTRAIALDSTKVSFYENLGAAQLFGGQHRAAVRTLEDGLARFGDTYLLNWNLSLAWQQLGDQEKSERYLARAKQHG